MNDLSEIIERHFQYIFETGILKVTFTSHASMINFLKVYKDVQGN